MSIGDADKRTQTHHVARLGILLDVRHGLLLLLLELSALALELALGLLQRALVLAKPLGGGDRTAEECVLEEVMIR